MKSYLFTAIAAAVLAAPAAWAGDILLNTPGANW